MKNNKKKWANSKTEFLSMSEWLNKRVDASRQYYIMLRASYLLRETDPEINPEKIQEKLRLLQKNLEGLSQELDTAKNNSKHFPEIKSQFFSAELTCRTLAAEIDDYLPIH